MPLAAVSVGEHRTHCEFAVRPAHYFPECGERAGPFPGCNHGRLPGRVRMVNDRPADRSWRRSVCEGSRQVNCRNSPPVTKPGRIARESRKSNLFCSINCDSVSVPVVWLCEFLSMERTQFSGSLTNSSLGKDSLCELQG